MRISLLSVKQRMVKTSFGIAIYFKHTKIAIVSVLHININCSITLP